MKSKKICLIVFVCVAFGLLIACSDDATATGSDADTDADADADGDTDSATNWYSGDPVETFCQSHLYACGDLIDNDGDGLVDAKDPDCLGPCDNNEAGFNTEIPGGNIQACRQECYFDQDNGGGNDNCSWDHTCDELEPVGPKDCDYSKSCNNCECEDWFTGQSDLCLDFCLPLVPNGCDCFGCCELKSGSGEYRFLGTPGCNVLDLESCSRCTPVDSCLNTCRRCELCINKSTIPDDCGGNWDTDSDPISDTDDTDMDTDIDTENMRCDMGVQPCGMADDSPCEGGTYCITGCCVQSDVFTVE